MGPVLREGESRVGASVFWLSAAYSLRRGGNPRGEPLGGGTAETARTAQPVPPRKFSLLGESRGPRENSAFQKSRGNSEYILTKLWIY